MRTRRSTVSALIVPMILLAGAVRATLGADDFGDLLKRAARDAVRDRVPGLPSDRGRSPAGSAPAVVGPATLEGGRGEHSPQGGEAFTAKTPDGWSLVAHRYRPTGPARPGASPIILCHGLTYNAMFWELDPSCSPARYFAAMGYDVWAVDLRGSGQSHKWVWKLEDAPTALFGEALRRASKGKLGPEGYASVDPKYANWTLDHHIVHDVPTLVRLVRAQTGAAAVTWVGHSMGGIVAIAHLARYANPGIGRLVAIGSQVTMPKGQVPIQFVREMLVAREGELAGQLTGRDLIEGSRTTVDGLFFNRENAMPSVYEALSTWAKDIPSVGLCQQYLALGNAGVLTDGKRTFDYSTHLANLTIPVLVGSGAADAFAPPDVQQYLYDRVGSPDKSLLIIGRANGFSVDAGHDDALVGLNSAREVYPRIAGWLEGDRKIPGVSSSAAGNPTPAQVPAVAAPNAVPTNPIPTTPPSPTFVRPTTPPGPRFVRPR